jgi:hypothetical protein
VFFQNRDKKWWILGRIFEKMVASAAVLLDMARFE